MKTGNKDKKKFYRCKYREHYYDDLTNTQICHNGKSGCYSCMCENIYQVNSCPFFEKEADDKGFFLEWNDFWKKTVDEFKTKLEQELTEKETKERALLEYLKKKYEK